MVLEWICFANVVSRSRRRREERQALNTYLTLLSACYVYCAWLVGDSWTQQVVVIESSSRSAGNRALNLRSQFALVLDIDIHTYSYVNKFLENSRESSQAMDIYSVMLSDDPAVEAICFETWPTGQMTMISPTTSLCHTVAHVRYRSLSKDQQRLRKGKVRHVQRFRSFLIQPSRASLNPQKLSHGLALQRTICSIE